MNCAQVCVLKQPDMISFSCLLVYQKTCAFKPNTSRDISINLPDNTLERGLANEEIGRLLVLADLLESDGTRAVSVGLLHSCSGGCRLAGSLIEKFVAGDISPF